MQRLKILGVALMAVFALGVVVSATASAAVSVLVKGAEAEETYKGESGKGTLEVLPGGITKEIVCQKDKSEGLFEAKKPLGDFHIDFESCKIAGAAACTGLGEAKEVILSLGIAHLVFDKLGTGEALGVGVLFLVEPTHFECAGVLLVVEGQVLCLIKPINVLAKHFEIVCKGSKGDPGEVLYWNEKGEEVKMGENLLLTHENEKAGEMSSENTTALILTKNEIEIMG